MKKSQSSPDRVIGCDGGRSHTECACGSDTLRIRGAAGDLAESRRLAAAIAQRDPNSTFGARLNEILADKSADAPTAARRVEPVLEEARQRIEVIRARLGCAVRLEPSLQERAIRADPELGMQPQKTDAESLRISVLLGALDAPAQQRLRDAGLHIEHAARNIGVAVGRVAWNRLLNLAAVEGVRRVELVRE